MNSHYGFVALLREEVGLPLEAADLGRPFDQLEGWDSVHLLTLLTALERATGHRISLPDALEAPSLEHLYAVAVRA